SAGLFRCLVVGLGETEVGRVTNEENFRKFGCNHFRRAVSGSVVYHDYFQRNALRLVLEGFEAESQQITAIPVGDANRDVNGSRICKLAAPRCHLGSGGAAPGRQIYLAGVGW